MNLRDKLKAIEKPKSPPKASEKQFTVIRISRRV